MKTSRLSTLLLSTAIGFALSSPGLAGDSNKVPRAGRDSVTVWNTNVPLTPHTADRSATPPQGYGRAGGMQPSPPLYQHPTGTVQTAWIGYGRY